MLQEHFLTDEFYIFDHLPATYVTDIINLCYR